MTCGYRNCQSRACGSIVRPDGHELAYCVAHEAIARHLPTLRTATCCTSEGCGRPQGSRSPLCKSCRPRYTAWGLDGYPVPQEAPMTEPTLTPPAAPQDAADGGATPSPAAEPLHPLEARRASLIARLYVAGFAKVDGPAENLWRFNGPNGAVLIPVGHPCEVERDFADMLDHAEKECAKVEAAATPADAVEPSVGDVADAPLFVGSTDSAPMQQRREAVVARLLALGFKEHEGTDTLRMFLGHGWSVPVPLPGHDESVRKADHMLDDAERLCSRMEKPEPTAPGPTLAEVQAELARERERADRAELDAVQERERADEAKAELAAIAALLDPEDAPAYDGDDQPIPLPTRVRTALMPDPIGKSELERRITKALDKYDAPKGFGSLGQASPYGRVLLTARENKQLKADKAALRGIIDDTEWIVHHCGSYGSTASLADRVLRLLPVERQRAILELQRAEAYIEVARLQARFLNPPPPGRLEECVAEVAEVEAKIAALDAGEVRE